MSQRSDRNRKRFSREGFQPLTHQSSNDNNMSQQPPRDVTIDIPLTKVTSAKSVTGARKPSALSPVISHQNPPEYDDALDEKQNDSAFQNGEGGRRRKLGSAGKHVHDPKDGTVTWAGKIYSAIYNFSVVTRYLLYVVPVAALIAVPLVLSLTVYTDVTIDGVPFFRFTLWLMIMWCTLWLSKLVAKFIPFVFQFLCGVVSPGTRKYAAILTNLEIPISLVGWAVANLVSFSILCGVTSTRWTSVMRNVLLATLCATLVLLAEKTLVQLIQISYHRKSFDDKIKQSKYNIYLVSLLYDASRTLFPTYCPEFAEEDYTISDTLELVSGRNSRGAHKRSGSNTPARLLQNMGRVKDNVTSAFGQVAQEITGKKTVFNPNAAHSIVVQALEKKHSTEALARRLWLSFVLEGRDALYPDDLAEVLGPDRATEAEEAFLALDADGNGDISLDEMILRLGEIGRARHAITHSMRDVDQAIHVLDNLLMTAVFIAVILIFVGFLNANFTTTLATTGTALLSLSFVFAATAQEVLGSCIFLFVKHPYDVGDRVDIGEEHYTVEKISLLYTIFRRVKDHKRTQVPHIVLNSLWIDNVSRSKAMREQLTIFVSFDTTLEDVELLKREMEAFVADKENSRDFQSDVNIEVTGIAAMDKLELKVEILHKSNWANEALRAARRSKFMCALVLALRKVPIYAPGGGYAPAGDKANPTYSVSISDSEAKENAQSFDDDKDKARMIPVNKPHGGEGADDAQGRSTSNDLLKVPSGGSIQKESAALQGLTKRNVAFDHARDQDEREDAIEEVRGMLRRESTTGRRRRSNSALSPSATSHARYGAQTIPTIPDASPQEPVNGPGQAPRVSYFEDSNYRPAPLAPGKSSQQESPYVQPPQRAMTSGQNLTTTTTASTRHDSATLPNSPLNPQDQAHQGPEYIHGTSFPQPQHSPPREQQRAYELDARSRERSNTPTSRRPVPGMNEMRKDLLQSPK